MSSCLSLYPQEVPAMSDPIIRLTTEEDIGAIIQLFLPQKRDPETFQWVITDGDNKFRSFVAEIDNQIVGHIAYVSTQYEYQGNIYTGVFTIEWIVNPQFSGQVGLKLYSKVLKIGDFTFIIGGTEVVNQIYPLLKFNQPLNVLKFLKVTRPLQYFQALDTKAWKKVAKTLYYSRPSLSFKAASFFNAVSLCVLEPGKGLLPGIDPCTVVNTCQEEHFHWLLKTPGVQVHSFTIKRSEVPIGTAMCYTQCVQGVMSGRIVFVSLLPTENSIWEQVLVCLEDFLVEQGCCVITTLASYAPFIDALRKSGHVVTHELPLWLKDRNKLFRDASWHFTYFEGDLAYRGIHLTDFTLEDV